MRCQSGSIVVRRAGASGWWAAMLLAAWPAAVSAQTPSLEPRVAVGKSVTDRGTLLQREEPGHAWVAQAAGDDVYSRDLVLALPGARAAVQPRDAAVRVGLR